MNQFLSNKNDDKHDPLRMLLLNLICILAYDELFQKLKITQTKNKRDNHIGNGIDEDFFGIKTEIDVIENNSNFNSGNYYNKFLNTSNETVFYCNIDQLDVFICDMTNDNLNIDKLTFKNMNIQLTCKHERLYFIIDDTDLEFYLNSIFINDINLSYRELRQILLNTGIGIYLENPLAMNNNNCKSVDFNVVKINSNIYDQNNHNNFSDTFKNNYYKKACINMDIYYKDLEKIIENKLRNMSDLPCFVEYTEEERTLKKRINELNKEISDMNLNTIDYQNWLSIRHSLNKSKDDTKLLQSIYSDKMKENNQFKMKLSNLTDEEQEQLNKIDEIKKDIKELSETVDQLDEKFHGKSIEFDNFIMKSGVILFSALLIIFSCILIHLLVTIKHNKIIN